MNVKKYPQSCLILEKKGKRCAIDPGSFVSGKYSADDLLPLDFILITHEHYDHADPDFIKKLLRIKNIPVFGNESTAKSLPGIVTKIIHDRERFVLDGFDITARELPHVLMVDGSPGPQNTGYVIDGTFFHSGDGIDIEGLNVDTAAIPIAGPDISPRDVYKFIKQIGCRRVIPVHNDYFMANPGLLSNENFYPGIKVILLADGESAEI